MLVTRLEHSEGNDPDVGNWVFDDDVLDPGDGAGLLVNGNAPDFVVGGTAANQIIAVYSAEDFETPGIPWSVDTMAGTITFASGRTLLNGQTGTSV